MSATGKRLIALLDYVERMARLGERVVFELKNYRQLLFHEHETRSRVGIVHDLGEPEGTTWLKIERLVRRDPPPVPAVIAAWITVSRDPSQQPHPKPNIIKTIPAGEAERLVSQGVLRTEDVMLPPNGGEGGSRERDAIFRLDNQPTVKQAVEAYLAGPWVTWAAEERPRRETIAIYDKFFSLQQTIEAEGTERPVELVWGIGLARWDREGRSIDHPLIEQLVEIDIDSTDGAIRIRPRSTEPQTALKPFHALEIPGADSIRRFAREFFAERRAEEEFSPFVRASFEPILRQAVAQLDKEGEYYPDVAVDSTDRKPPPLATHLVVTDTWAIYARSRSDSTLIEDLGRLKEAVTSSNEDALPQPATRLVSEPADFPPGPEISLAAGLGGIAPLPGRTAPVGAEADYFFPKPFNDEQIEIVRRLEQEDGVVVQGPPGTGKSHTIANIICHYLATGRRVLVVSKGEAALAVLENQIPKEIRELTIRLLTSEREGLKQLERAVTILANEVKGLDPGRLARDIADSERCVLALRGRMVAIDNELGRWADKHLRRTDGSAGGLTPYELARKIIEERSTHEWLADRPRPGDEPKFSDADVAALRASRRKLANDLAYLGAPLPSPSDLPDAATITAIHEDLANAARLEAQRVGAEVPPLATSVPNALARAERLAAALAGVVDAHVAGEEKPWLARVYALSAGHRKDAALAGVLAEVFDLGQAIAQARGEVLAAAVQLPGGALEDAGFAEAVARAARGERPFPLIAIGKSRAKELYAAVTVDGSRITTTTEAAAKVARYVTWRKDVGRFINRWNALAPELELPELADRSDATGRTIAEISTAIARARAAATEELALIRSEVPELFPYGLDGSAIARDKEAATRALTAVRLNLAKHKLAGVRTRLAAITVRLDPCRGAIVDRLRAFLSAEVGNPGGTPRFVAEAWEALMVELARVKSLATELSTVTHVTALISASGAPAWAERLRSDAVAGVEDALTPTTWRESWRWAQATSYLREIDGRARIRKVSEERLAVDAEIKRVFTEVVRLRTYLALRQKMSPSVYTALVMFASAIRYIGQGTGIRARRFRREAREAMERCYGAVPCWIMPTWRVSESLPATLGSFDLVVVDEASQSDVTALPALVRGKKVLIVGDDKQVSPAAVAVEERQILQLKHNYLVGQPFGAMMLPGRSLYDLMGAVFAGDRLMLREHFRCVEPIIRFSFQFYTEEIRPLRIPTASERLDPPLVDIHVPHGQKEKDRPINRAEADVIVDEIAKIVADPAFKRRSIGVVSLIGAYQAALIQQRLLERIGETAYLDHAIACGDSATFQGKERDIMFVSMVAGPDDCRAVTGLVYQQRFNVALSRARDREYLVRSVTEEMLNPNDLKAKVLRHFREPMGGAAPTEGDPIELCESPFERDVYGRLVAGGYRVRPQVKTGGFRIDLVVEGANDRRLAVELDGDKYHGPERWIEDYNRQLALERVGWRFWRVWGSSWTLDPDDCFADLDATLKRMRIEPLGGRAGPSIYTEHRVVEMPRKEANLADAPLRAAGTEEPALTLSVMPSPAAGVTTGKQVAERTVEVGDRVVIAYNDDPGRQITITVSAEADDSDMGIIHYRKPLAEALLGASEGDEIEVPAGGRTRLATILSVVKESAQSQF